MLPHTKSTHVLNKQISVITSPAWVVAFPNSVAPGSPMPCKFSFLLKTPKNRDEVATARVMSHDVKRIRLEVYGFGWASTGGPSAGTIVRPVFTFPGVVRPSTPKRTDYEPWSVPSSPEYGLTGWLGTLRVSSLNRAVSLGNTRLSSLDARDPSRNSAITLPMRSKDPRIETPSPFPYATVG